MKGNLDSVVILQRGGMSETVMDRLGRTPSELQPEGLEGFASDIGLDTELAAGSHAEVRPEKDDMDEQMTSGKQFSALDLDDSIDLGHVQSILTSDAFIDWNLELAIDGIHYLQNKLQSPSVPPELNLSLPPTSLTSGRGQLPCQPPDCDVIN